MLLILLIYGSLPLSADVVVDGLNYRGPVTINGVEGMYVDREQGAKITSPVVEIPAYVEYEGKSYPVIELDYAAFMDSKILEEIKLPETLLKLNQRAFSGCVNLKKISIPNSVTYIGPNCFDSCSSLTDLTLPEELITIDSYVFSECSGLTSLVIPDKTESIEYCAFYNCSSITTLMLGENLKVIGETSPTLSSDHMPNLTDVWVKAAVPPILYQYSPLSKNVVVHVLSGALSAYESAPVWSKFTLEGYEPHEIANRTVVDGLTYEYDQASGTYLVAPQSEVESDNYQTLTNLVIPESINLYGTDYKVSGILEKAFAGSQLSSFTISGSIKSIPARAFRNCKNITTVNIPEQIETIGAEAFAGCDNIQNVVCKPSVPPAIQENTFSTVTYENAKLSVLEEYEDAYKNAVGWSVFLGSIFGVYKVESGGLWYELNSSTMNATVIQKEYDESSGTSAYTGDVYKIQDKVVLKDKEFTVNAIADFAFDGAQIASLQIPESVTTIGHYAFFWSSIKKVDVPSFDFWYTRFDETNRPFNDNPGTLSVAGKDVTSITVSKDLQIPTYAFRGCTGITSFIVENGVKEFTTAYEGVEEVKTLQLGENLSVISAEAVSSMTSLTHVTSLAMKAPSIPDNAFDDYVYGRSQLYIPSIGADTYFNSQGWNKFTYKNLIDVTLAAYPGFKFRLATESGLRVSAVDNSIAGDIVIPSQVEAQQSIYEVTEIGDFVNCGEITSITIPSTVNAMINVSGCSKLDKLYFADEESLLGMKYGKMPFDLNGKNLMIYVNGKALTDVVINSRYTGLGAFLAGYQGLRSVTIPSSIKIISGNAMNNCRNLKTVVFEGGNSSAITVEDGAFKGSPVENLTIGRTLTLSCGYLFPNLKNLKFVEGLSDISERMFEGCQNLESIDWGQGITSIGSRAFLGCASLKTLRMPSSLKSIGANAFSQCNSLATVSFGDGVSVISDGCFRNCTSLSSISWNGKITDVGLYAFMGCTTLKSVEFPGYLSRLGAYAFADCISLTEVTFTPAETELIAGEYLFRNCPVSKMYYGRKVAGRNEVTTGIPFAGISGEIDLTVSASVGQDMFNGVSLKSVTFTKGVKEIGSRAFFGCKVLDKLTISGEMTSIGTEAFNGCESLSELVIEDSREELTIGSDAFSNCKIENLYLGRTVKSSGSYYDKYGVFSGNNNLKSVELGRYVTEIADYEFRDCPNIHSLTVGVGVRTIAKDAFICGYATYPTIAKVIWLPNTRPQGYENVRGSVNYVSQSSYNLDNQIEYRNLSSKFWVDGVLYVFNRQAADRTCVAIDCKYRPSMSSTEVPNFVTYEGIEFKIEAINQYTFYMNEYVENAKVGNNILSIGDYSFYGCSKLQSIFVPNSVGVLGAWAFAGCSKLESAVVGTRLTEIREGCFSGDKLLSEFMVPANVEKIGNQVFDGCEGLKKFEIMNRTKELSLGYSAKNIDTSDNPVPGKPLFADSHLEEVYIGGNITYSTLVEDGYSPFYRNDYLKKVTIHDNETEVSDYEFYGCSSLVDVIIGNGVERIGDYAFSGCFELTTFSFGTKVRSIGIDAFSDCSRMVSLTSHNMSVPVCGSQALDDIDKFKCTLYVPSNSVVDYSNADQWRNFFHIEPIQAVAVPVLSLRLDVTTLTLTQGEQAQINATVYPADASVPTLNWESTNDEVAMVSQFGNVVAIGAGSCYITASTTDGSGLSETCFVTVNEYSGVYDVEVSDIKLIRNGSTLTIVGAADDDKVCVVGIGGNVEYDGTDKTIERLPSGMHIVIVRDKVFKIMI